MLVGISSHGITTAVTPAATAVAPSPKATSNEVNTYSCGRGRSFHHNVSKRTWISPSSSISTACAEWSLSCW